MQDHPKIFLVDARLSKDFLKKKRDVLYMEKVIFFFLRYIAKVELFRKMGKCPSSSVRLCLSAQSSFLVYFQCFKCTSKRSGNNYPNPFFYALYTYISPCTCINLIHFLQCKTCTRIDSRSGHTPVPNICCTKLHFLL